jgi:hypothetical protein
MVEEGPNAPRNDWGFSVEFLVRPYLGVLDACFLPEIGIVGAGWDWKGRRIGCGGARGPNPRTQIATKKQLPRREMDNKRGIFFNSSKESLGRKRRNF